MVNLGTPDAPTAAALRPYLAEFLSDPRVIEYPRWLWWPILKGILRIRPRRSAQAYARIWTSEGSPLRVLSEALTEAVDAELARRGHTVKVALAMSYGHPRITDTIAAMQRQGIGRLLVLPLYPQYSATSSGSVVDAVAEALKTLRWPPQVQLLGDYHDDAGYLDALAESVRGQWREHGRGERLLISFHGIPERYVRAGDPYAAQCRATAKGLRERLELDENAAPLAFQSRLGREPWLSPYTDRRVRELAAEGVRKLDVICPGFVVDCLETLEEIAMQNRDFFLAAGGEDLRYIPALNTDAAHVKALCDLLERHLATR
jgi:ferrochelatase